MPAITIPTPKDFRFLPTVFSHGWYMLPPFHFDHHHRVLERVHQFDDGTVALLKIQEGEVTNTLQIGVEARGRLGRQRQAEAISAVTACLNLAHDLTMFYRVARRSPRYRWVERMGAGRFLTAPTVWEDLAKTLLTTNTTWAGTVQMCRRLVTLGEQFGDKAHAFPSPKRVAAMRVPELNAHIRAGYRSAYLHELASAVATGQLDAEKWRAETSSSEDLYPAIRAIKGFGPYAAGSMCRLLGHFDRLGLDSACRSIFRQRYNAGKQADDAQIADFYRPFGQWCGLAVWMDVMKEHMEKHVVLSHEP
jgi:3-methyladenine DNA glycosylase/8-oxoguanine DNA glycosylase